VLAIAPPECELAQVTLESGAGFVVPPGDPAALAASIVAAAADPVGLAAMGHRARQRAVERYDRRIATARFAQLLHEVAGEGRLEASAAAVPAAASMTLSEESL